MWGLTAVFGLILSGSLLFALEWRLALLAVAGLALSTVGPWLLGGRASRASGVLQEEQARLASRIHEDLGGASDRTGLRHAGQPALAISRSACRLLSNICSGSDIGRVGRTHAQHCYARLQSYGADGGCDPRFSRLDDGGLTCFLLHSSNGLSLSVASMTWSMPYFIAANSGLRRLKPRWPKNQK